MYAAYNSYGDLITTADTYNQLYDKVLGMGWNLDEVMFYRVGLG